MARDTALFQRATKIAPLVQRYLPNGLQFGDVMAMAEWESGLAPAKTNNVSSAVGILQVLKGSAPKYGITPEQRTDPEAVLRGAKTKFFEPTVAAVKSIFPNVASSDLAALVYYAHSEGMGSRQKPGKMGLWSALIALKKRGLAPTAENVMTLVQQGVLTRGNKGGGIIGVKRNRDFWQRAVADLGGNWDGLVAWGQTNAPGGAVLASRRGGPAVQAVSRVSPASRNALAGSSGGGALVVIGAIGLGLIAFLVIRGGDRKRKT